MNKIKYIAMVLALSLGLMFANAHADESVSKNWFRGYEVGEIVGFRVVDYQGEYLGRVSDLVIDTNGRVAFAVLDHGGILGIGEKRVAVPYHTLSYDVKEGHYVLDISMEKFESAPAFNREILTSGKLASDIYKYYGQQPYWSEESGAAMEPMEMEGTEHLTSGASGIYLYFGQEPYWKDRSWNEDIGVTMEPLKMEGWNEGIEATVGVEMEGW